MTTRIDPFERVMEEVYKYHSYTMDAANKRIITSRAQHILVEAPAGGTKTTLAQSYCCKQKIARVAQAFAHNQKHGISMSTSYNREELLAIVYNNHNTSDIQRTHYKLYSSCESLGLLSSDPNSLRYSSPEITAVTLHGLAREMVVGNLGYFRLRTFDFAKPYKLDMLLQSCMKTVLKSTSGSSTVKKLYDLYTNLLMFDPIMEEQNRHVFLLETRQLPVDYLKLLEVFILFDKRKPLMKIFEFSDSIKMAMKLLEEPSIREYYHNRYKIILADEIQDFTQLMFKFYSMIVSDKTKTFGIGDPDQTLYRFNGASPDNINKYEELTNLTNVERHSLTINHRCKSKTFVFANNIVKKLPNRNRPEIIAANQGGRMVVNRYASYTEEVQTVLTELKSVPYATTAVIARKGNDLLLLSRALYKDDCPVSYVNAQSFRDHEFYSKFWNLMSNMFLHRGRDTWKYLYQIFPFNKERLSNFLGLDDQEMPENFPEITDWAYLNFSELTAGQKLASSSMYQVMFLQGVAEHLQILPTSKYIDLLIEMFLKNYYQFAFDSYAEDIYFLDAKKWLLEDMSSRNNLRKVVDKRAERDNLISRGPLASLVLSTIHGVKGLQFDRVIICRLEEDSALDYTRTQEDIDFQLENDIRTYYVAATRQLSCLVVMCSQISPHALADPDNFASQLALELDEQFVDSEASSKVFNSLSSAAPANFAIKRKFKLEG